MAVLEFLGQLDMLPFGPESDSSADISNAVLTQVDTTDLGEVLDVTYDITLTNMEDDTVTVRAITVEAESRELARALSMSDEQHITADSEVDSGKPSIRVPIPLEAGCIIVRVEVLEEDGDRIDDAETPAFDPYDPANPACPSGATSTSGEVAA